MYKERCNTFLGPECHLRESQSLLLVIEIQPLCFYFLLMMHLCLLRDRITPLRNEQHSHSHLCFAHTFSHCFCPYLFTERPGLFNYRFSTQSLLTGCMSGRMLAQSQTANRVQKSLQIILNLLHWPTVQNIHLHCASLKSALTASKHWTPSTATTVSIFKQYPPQSIQLHTFPCPRVHTLTHTHIHLDVCAAVADTQSSFTPRQTLF